MEEFTRNQIDADLEMFNKEQEPSYSQSITETQKEVIQTSPIN